METSKLQAVPVQGIRANIGEHDIMFRGRVLKLKAESYPEGIHLGYYEKVKASKKLPPPFCHIVGDDKEIDDLVWGSFVKVKWYEKLVGITLERKVKYRLNQMKKIITKETKKNKKNEYIKSKLGI